MKKELSKKLAAYSGVAGVSLLVANISDAQIIYSNPPDINLVGVGAETVLDLDNNGVYDVRVRIIDSYPLSTSDGSWGYGVAIENFIYNTGRVQGFMYGDCKGDFFYGYGLRPLKKETIISGNDYFPLGLWYIIQYGEVLNWDYYGATCHRWAGLHNGIAGFRIRVNGNNFRYGWIRLSVNYPGSKVTIHDWAINSQVNAPIHAGQTMRFAEESGEPATEIHIYSYDKHISISENTQNIPLEISVFNLLGEEMKRINSSDQEIIINAEKFPAGIYIVKVNNGKKIMSSEVLIE
jgi:hypothetical protein